MKLKSARTTPKIAGSLVYGEGSLTAAPGSSVHQHQGQYHVFVGMKKVLTTPDRQVALAEAARTPTL